MSMWAGMRTGRAAGLAGRLRRRWSGGGGAPAPQMEREQQGAAREPGGGGNCLGRRRRPAVQVGEWERREQRTASAPWKGGELHGSKTGAEARQQAGRWGVGNRWQLGTRKPKQGAPRGD